MIYYGSLYFDFVLPCTSVNITPLRRMAEWRYSSTHS